MDEKDGKEAYDLFPVGEAAGPTLWNPRAPTLPMNKLILLGVVLLLGVLFAAMPVTDKKIGFAFFEGSIRSVDYLYFLMEHIILIILCYIIYSESTTDRLPLLVFLWVQVADLADFVMTFNNPWLNLGGIPVSMNTLGMVIFVFSIAYDRGRR